MKLWRIFRASFSLALRRELTFRVNLIFQIIMTVIGAASSLAVIGVVYTQTQTLGGWNIGETIILLGTFQIVSGLLSTFLYPNITNFGGQIKDGRLDGLLLQPIPSLFQASLGSCAPLSLTSVVIGMIVTGTGLSLLGTVPSLTGILGWLELILVGLTIAWSSRVLLACLAFWAPAVELDVLYGALWEFGRYPVTIYQQPLRFLLTYLLPVAFIATFPTMMLTRGANGLLLIIGLAIGVVAILVALLLWKVGLRRYTSATS